MLNWGGGGGRLHVAIEPRLRELEEAAASEKEAVAEAASAAQSMRGCFEGRSEGGGGEGEEEYSCLIITAFERQ